MKRLLAFLVTAVILSGGILFAHGDNEHVTGTVTAITDNSISVQTTAKQPRTIQLDAKAMIIRGSAHLTVKDIKVGDRVVIDVNKKSSLATEVKIGAAAAKK